MCSILFLIVNSQQFERKKILQRRINKQKYDNILISNRFNIDIYIRRNSLDYFDNLILIIIIK